MTAADDRAALDRARADAPGVERTDGDDRRRTRARPRERTRGERAFARLAAISSSIGLDDVLTRTLEAASRLPAVGAAMIVLLQDRDAEPVVATLRMSAEEAARQSFPRADGPDGRRPSQRADEALHRAKEGGKGQVMATDKRG